MSIRDDITNALEALDRPARAREIITLIQPTPTEVKVRMTLAEMVRDGELWRPSVGLYAPPHMDVSLAEDTPERVDEPLSAAAAPAVVKHPWRGFEFGQGTQAVDPSPPPGIEPLRPPSSVPPPSPLGSELDAAMTRFERRLERTFACEHLERKCAVLTWLASLTQMSEPPVAHVLQAIIGDLERLRTPLEQVA